MGWSCKKKRKEMETGEVGFLFCVWSEMEEKKKEERKKMRVGVYWPVKPEWRLLAGGKLWGRYEKIGGERLLAGWRREEVCWRSRNVWCDCLAGKCWLKGET